MIMRWFISLLLTAAFAALQAVAEEKREHGTHVHGLGELNIAVEENMLLVELISPAANIVGFEYKPGNEEQEQAIEQAIDDLKQVENLFVLSQQADCTIDRAEVTSSILNEDHGNDEEAHNEELEHDDHDHTDGHDETADDAVHSEFYAEYTFQCENIQELSQIEVKLFEAFPLSESLTVQVLSASGQSAKTLNKKDTFLDL